MKLFVEIESVSPLCGLTLSCSRSSKLVRIALYSAEMVNFG